jgi:hypothetical protein
MASQTNDVAMSHWHALILIVLASPTFANFIRLRPVAYSWLKSRTFKPDADMIAYLRPASAVVLQ